MEKKNSSIDGKDAQVHFSLAVAALFTGVGGVTITCTICTPISESRGNVAGQEGEMVKNIAACSRLGSYW